jgi:hypothetical protein
MKTKLLLSILLLSSSFALAQDPTDALRYSWLTPGGTARSQAVGSATTALGGDLSALFTNPAGLGFYKTGEMVITPGFSFNNAKSGYLGSNEKDSKSTMNYGAMGLVFATGGSRNGNWKNFSFGLGVNRAANFNGNTYFKGLNNKSSYSEKYLEELTSNNVTDPNAAASNFPYGSSLAFNTFLIDTVQGAGGSVSGYRSVATPQTGVTQEQRISTKGGIADYSLGASANLKDKLFLGAALGFTMLKYDRTTQYTETDATKAINNFNYFSSEETLRTEGSGINLKLGMIFKPVENIRLGLSFQTPTLYDMKDTYTARVTTDLEGYGGGGVLTQSSLDLTNNEPGNYQYKYTAPLKAAFGFALVLREINDVTKQRGFLTADVEYVDYRSAKFSSSDSYNGDYFNSLNNTIRSQYRGALNFRAGGELKFNTIMVRGGFGYYGNPYASSVTDKGSRMNISGGLGYRHKGIFVDLTYVHQITKDNYYPYRLTGNVFYPVAVKDTHGNILLTFGFKF